MIKNSKLINSIKDVMLSRWALGIQTWKESMNYLQNFRNKYDRGSQNLNAGKKNRDKYGLPPLSIQSSEVSTSTTASNCVSSNGPGHKSTCWGAVIKDRDWENFIRNFYSWREEKVLQDPCLYIRLCFISLFNTKHAIKFYCQ